MKIDQTRILAMAETVVAAAADLETARVGESSARSRATDCLNRLNIAQRGFDAAIAELKTGLSLRDSDWHRQVKP